VATSRPGLLARAAAVASALVARPPSAPAARADAGPPGPGPWPAGLGRVDCAPGFCGPGPAFGDESLLRWVGAYIGLPRDTIDALCVDQLMWRIVSQIVDDMLKGRPKLAGERLGELSDVTDWLWDRGAAEALKAALIYAREYGGGAIVCFLDDGKLASEPIDPAGNWTVRGFMALPKWYITPAGIGSPRAGQAWYGPRIGRPEHYIISPDNIGGHLPADLGPMLARAGNTFHRSRVVPFHFRPEMDYRQARRFPNWNGWGPGVVEACVQPYLTRKAGISRTDDIMNSVVVNVLQMKGVMNAISTPSGGAPLRKVLEFIKACRDWTAGHGVPLVAIDKDSDFKSITHSLAGIADLLREQRKNLIDHVDYTEVALFGTSSSGMSGDDKKGEWQGYYQRCETMRETWIWTDGAFGGGLRQLVLLAMLCPGGPTRGQIDPTVQATWPPLWTESNLDRSTARLKDAQARNLELAGLGLTPQAMLRHDPTVQQVLPSLDVDEEPLPTLSNGALEDPAAGPGESALTAAQATKQLTGQGEAGAEDAAPTASFPPDLITAQDARRILKCGDAALARWVADGTLQVYRVPVGKDRYKRRYSLSGLLQASTGGGAPGPAALAG
jgi:hypothetical protein